MKKTIILSLVAVTALSACTVGAIDERQAYIDSTIAVGCLPNFNPMDSKNVSTADDIWVKNGIKVDQIVDITNKYKDDKDALTEILAGLRACTDKTSTTSSDKNVMDIKKSDVVVKNQGDGVESNR